VLMAFTREVSPCIQMCQLTFMKRQAINLKRAFHQHRTYVDKLRSLGVKVLSVPSTPWLPDAVFVEDTAVVLPELAIIAAPALHTRRTEVCDVAQLLKLHRDVRFLEGPATMEGGDIIHADKHLFIGESLRTNKQGISQLRDIVSSFGYATQSVRVSGCLHLSTGAAYIGRNTMLVNPAWIGVNAFNNYEAIVVSPDEPWASNVLNIDGNILMPDSFPHTRARLERRGFTVEVIDISEFQKAEAGVTCMSLRFESQ
jgi:dimethylargininase